MQNKMRDTQNNRKEKGIFTKKHINHDPKAESTRAVYGEPKARYLDEERGV